MSYFVPEIWLIGSIMFVIIVSMLFSKRNTYIVNYIVSVFGIGCALWTAIASRQHELDGLFTHSAVPVLILSLSLIIFIAAYNLKKFNTQVEISEYPLFYLACVLGLLISATASNFLTLYIGLELQALAMYVMVALDRHNLQASEAGLRYYIFGSAASAMMLYGFSIVYGLTGDMNLEHMTIVGNGGLSDNLFYVMGPAFIVAGFCFKAASFPMYAWAPEVYRGASSPVALTISTLPKIAIFVVMCNFLYSNDVIAKNFEFLAYFLGIASMVVGIVGALSQTNLRRFLAYSSVQSIGYVMLMLPMKEYGHSAALLYMSTYSITLIGLFVCITRLRNDDRSVAELTIADLSGLGSQNRFAAISIAIFLLSMAGIPPLAGFITKARILSCLLNNGFIFISVIIALLSVIGMYYYIRIVKVMFFDEPVGHIQQEQHFINSTIVASCAAFAIFMLLLPMSI